MSRNLLYITPYFPPLSRVGALRPLKFVRHLPRFDWTPIVLCDLWPGAATDGRLLDAVPAGVPVIRDYSGRARSAERAFRRRGGDDARPRRPHWIERHLPVRLSPELLPLSEHALNLPHAFAAAGRVLSEHRCDAILVNADPFEALLVGAALSRRSGLPLVLDLRDPWAPCDLRRPQRPTPVRYLVDRIERYCVETASAVVLNTDTSLADYRSHYADLDPEIFHVIPNHTDRSLINGGRRRAFECFTLLYLGRFRRYVEGHILLETLAELRRRGHGERLQLVVTGECPPSVLEIAGRLGVASMLRRLDPVPYGEIGATMDAADLLVAVSHRSRQRIPAKLYDYLTSPRPILAVADSPELTALAGRVGGISVAGLDSPRRVADRVEEVLNAGRHQEVSRHVDALFSETATARLVEILERR